jgi:hypothetical protein
VNPAYICILTVWAFMHLGLPIWAEEITERYVVNVLSGKDHTFPDKKSGPDTIPFLSVSIQFDPGSGALLQESYVKLVPIGHMLKSQTMLRKRLLLVCCTGLNPATDQGLVRRLLANMQHFLSAQVGVPTDRVRTMTMAERALLLPQMRLAMGGKTARVEIFVVE